MKIASLLVLLAALRCCPEVTSQCPLECSNGMWNRREGCLPEGHVCDGSWDCADGEDETNCHQCRAGAWMCGDRSRCIPRHWLCDGRKDCQDNSDELDCVKSCRDDEWLCKDGAKCIPKSWVCAGRNDCNDGSDESYCKTSCPDGQWLCNDGGRCITKGSVCDNASDCDDASDELNCVTTCGADQWLCKDRSECIDLNLHCNGREDCDDLSDEANCSAKCDDRRWKCATGDTCIGTNWLCDGRAYCVDYSDELNCTSCKNNSWLCGDGSRCILQTLVCNGAANCDDKSDELDCVGSCLESEWRCKDGSKCLNTTSLCDGRASCVDNSDEWNCVSSCRKDQWLCKDGSKCISRAWVCDGHKHCSDRSDESNCTTCKYAELECPTFDGSADQEQCIKDNQLGDGNKDCLGGQDEACVRNGPGIFRCSDDSSKNTLLSFQHYNCCKMIDHWADQKHLVLGDDEWLCVLSGTCQSHYFCNAETVQPLWQFCNDRYTSECSDSKSEFGFKCSGLSSTGLCVLPQINLYDDFAQCADKSDLCFVGGELKCFLCLDKRLVISQGQVCDGVADCYDLSDECLCGDQAVCEAILGEARHNCPPGRMHCHDKTDCLDIEKVLCNTSSTCQVNNNVKYCSDLVTVTEHRETMTCYNSAFNDTRRLVTATKCDERPECWDLSDECSGCKSPPAFCTDTCVLVKSRYGPVCLGAPALPGPFVCGINETALCPKRYTCSQGDLTSIDVTQLCDGIIDCQDASDEDQLRCSGRFYCRSKKPISVASKFVEDGFKQCSDGSDECPDVSKRSSIFSSQKEMIANVFFRACFWVMGVVACVFNLLVFATTLREMLASQRNITALKQNTNVFIMSLSAADFMMGCYLLGIAVKGLQLSGDYCSVDAAWRTSSTCSGLGVILVAASQISAFTMTAMTAFRLKSLRNPVDGRSLKLKEVYSICIAIWVLSFLLAAIPTFYFRSGYFVSHVWFSSRFFRSDKVSTGQMFQLARRIQRNLTKPTWHEVTQLIHSAFPALPISGTFGYYGETSVCMPRLFASVTDSSWEYSIFLVTVNFVLFVFMLASYVVIYSESKKMTKRRWHQINTDLQRRISRLLITDFLCWIPLCICGFLAVGGVKLSNDVYIVSAGILLPINSAMNPLLYSSVFDKLCARCKNRVAANSAKPSNEIEIAAVATS